MKSIYLVALIALLASTSYASAKIEKQVTRTIYEISDFPDLEKSAREVCSSNKLAISDKLKTACNAGSFPSVTKSGAFRNTGIGAELNTLIRQVSHENQGH